VIDELLAGTSTAEERRARWAAGPANQAAGGAGDGGRADRPCAIRAASGAARPRPQPAQRHDPKTFSTEHGKVPIDAPRDRDGSFEPQIVRKRQRRFVGFDEKILALYSSGLSVRDIRAQLQEICPVADRCTALTDPKALNSCNSSVRDHAGILAAFHTGYKCHKSAQPAAAQGDQHQGSIGNEEAIRKLVFLALQNAVPRWAGDRNWTTAPLACKIHFGDRVPTLQTDCH
jgi:mutator family transposase